MSRQKIEITNGMIGALRSALVWWEAKSSVSDAELHEKLADILNGERRKAERRKYGSLIKSVDYDSSKGAPEGANKEHEHFWMIQSGWCQRMINPLSSTQTKTRLSTCSCGASRLEYLTEPRK